MRSGGPFLITLLRIVCELQDFSGLVARSTGGHHLANRRHSRRFAAGS